MTRPKTCHQCLKPVWSPVSHVCSGEAVQPPARAASYRCEKPGCRANAWTMRDGKWICHYCERPMPARPDAPLEVVKLVDDMDWAWSLCHSASVKEPDNNSARVFVLRYPTRESFKAVLSEFSRLQALSAYRPQVQTPGEDARRWDPLMAGIDTELIAALDLVAKDKKGHACFLISQCIQLVRGEIPFVSREYRESKAPTPPPKEETARPPILEPQEDESGPFVEVNIVLGEGGIGVSGGKLKSAPFMDTLSFDKLEAPMEIGAILPLIHDWKSHRVHLRFTKPEAVDVVIGVLNQIKASFPATPVEPMEEKP